MFAVQSSALNGLIAEFRVECFMIQADMTKGFGGFRFRPLHRAGWFMTLAASWRTSAVEKEIAMIRRAALIAFAVAIVGGLMAATTGGASAAVPSAACATSAVIEIEPFAFIPASVPPGRMSTATLTALNCTDQPQQITEIWFGQFTEPGAGIPSGCPAIDPLVMSAALLPYGTVSSHITYLVPASCTASQLVITADISGQGGMLAQGTAILMINQNSTNAGSRPGLARA